MPVPPGKTIRIADKDFSPGSDNKEILSIELMPDGFSFAILDANAFKYQFLLATMFDEEQKDLSLLPDRLLADPEIHELLSRKYLKTTIACFTPQLTLLPNELFIKEDQEAMHRFSCSVPLDHLIRTDRLNNLQGYGVYSLPERLVGRLGQLFPEHRLWHSGSALIENMLAASRLEDWPGDVILHIRKSCFEVMLLDKKKLVYFNVFQYRDFGDLMYFLFYVLEQFGRDAKSSWAILAGEISMDSPGFASLASYFGKVSFTGRNDAYRYSLGFENYPHHYFFHLLNLNFCG